MCQAQALVDGKLARLCKLRQDRPEKAQVETESLQAMDARWFADRWADLLLDLDDAVAAFYRRQLLNEKYAAKTKEAHFATGEKREVKKREKDKIFETLQQVADLLADDLDREMARLRPVFHDLIEAYSKGIGHLLTGKPLTFSFSK